jgi:hypothetical protein
MISEEQVEIMLKSKIEAAKLVMDSDAFIVVTLEGYNVHTHLGHYHSRDKLALVGAMDLAIAAMNTDTLNFTETEVAPIHIKGLH